jgi:hypothetical protein
MMIVEEEEKEEETKIYRNSNDDDDEDEDERGMDGIWGLENVEDWETSENNVLLRCV